MVKSVRISNFVNAIDVLVGQGGLKYYVADPKRFSVSAFRMAKGLQRFDPSIDTIIDVGSNIGQFMVTINNVFPQASYYCFEPDIESFSVLSEKVSSMSNVKAFNWAVSDKVGRIPFFKHEYSLINSALDVSSGNEHPNYKDSDSQEISVTAVTLDSISGELEIGSSALLKLDVQGLELKALEGATKMLEKVKYVLLEVAFDNLYIDQPSFQDIHSFLAEKGFYFKAALDFHSGKDLAIIEMDALYVRKNFNIK